MAKDYKRKEYIEKNYADAPKLPKRVKRALEGSNRLKAKKEVKEIIEEEEPVDEYWEVESELSNLCFILERLIGNSYKCTCPIDSITEMCKHIEELKVMINRIHIQKVGE